MDVTDIFVLLVSFAVIAIVVYGGYHRARQSREQAMDRADAGHVPSGVPAE